MASVEHSGSAAGGSSSGDAGERPRWGAAASPLRVAAAVLPVNNLGGDRDGLRDIDGAAVGPRQAAAAVLPVNNVGGGRVGLIGIGGATAGQRRCCR